MRAERPVAGRRREQLLGLLDRQLVGRHVLRHARALLAALHVGAVAADAEDDPLADRQRVDRARVDLGQVADERVQARVALGAAVVEVAQPVDALLVAGGDPVEVVLHLRGEVVVDEPR